MFKVDGLTLSDHARRRMNQRAIKLWMVKVALSYGEIDYDGHGCIRYTITDKVLKNTPYENKREQLRGLCVVVSVIDGTIVTVEWVYKLRRRCPRLTSRHPVKNLMCYFRSNQWIAQKPLILA